MRQAGELPLGHMASSGLFCTSQRRFLGLGMEQTWDPPARGAASKRLRCWAAGTVAQAGSASLAHARPHVPLIC